MGEQQRPPAAVCCSALLASLRLAMAATPGRRASTLVKDTNHDDACGLVHEAYGVREPVKKSALESGRDPRELGWQSGDSIQRLGDSRRERVPQPGLLLLLPGRCRASVELGVRAEDDQLHLARRCASSALRSAWTSDHGRTPSGSASCSARRRSSSARCSSSIGISCSRATMRSQRACTYSICSPTGSSSKPGGGSGSRFATAQSTTARGARRSSLAPSRSTAWPRWQRIGGLSS